MCGYIDTLEFGSVSGVSVCLSFSVWVDRRRVTS